jgi:hypothetical protein
MFGTGLCVECGKIVEPAQAIIREDGVRCPACNLRQEVRDDEAKAVQREADAFDQSLSRRAKRMGRAHAIIWGSVLIAYCGKHPVWFAPLAPVVLALAFGLAWRKRWAYFAALALDGATALAIGGWAVITLPFGELWLPAIVVGVAVLFVVLLWSIKGAYLRVEKTP